MGNQWDDVEDANDCVALPQQDHPASLRFCQIQTKNKLIDTAKKNQQAVVSSRSGLGCKCNYHYHISANAGSTFLIVTQFHSGVTIVAVNLKRITINQFQHCMQVV